MVANDWLCQFLADVLDVTVRRPQVTETTALGAAMLAAVGAGEFTDLEAAAMLWQVDRGFAARMAPDQRERLLRGWRNAVAQALATAPAAKL
jgi:glycerol kinase